MTRVKAGDGADREGDADAAVGSFGWDLYDLCGPVWADGVAVPGALASAPGGSASRRLAS
jgi:hypothetical protein